MDSKTLTTAGCSFTYLEQGDGTPLVLLHGIGSGARSWIHQVEGLSKSFRVIAWDAPGYGGSTDLAPERPTADDYALALERFLSALRIDRFHLVGHSLGTVMASRFARLHPDRIITLTLSGIAAGHGRLPDEERERLRRDRLDALKQLGPRGMAESRGPRLLGKDPTEDAKRAVIDTMAEVRPHGYTQAVYMLSTADTAADVRALSREMPVQVIYGDADVITPPEQVLRVAGERPGAPVHVIEGAGHALYLEQAERFNGIVSSFARRAR